MSSEDTILPIVLGPFGPPRAGQSPAEAGPVGAFNLVLPRQVSAPPKAVGRIPKTPQIRGTEDSQDPADLRTDARRPSRKPRKALTAMDSPLPSRSVGILYVGRTEGELSTALGKVGMSQDRASVVRRAASFKASDRVFDFVLEAAYEVSLPAGTVMKRVEDAVLNELEQGGLERYRENFVVPAGHMPFLAHKAADALSRLGYAFDSLDIQEHRQEALDRNSRTWARLRNRPAEAEEEDIYQAWLQDHCSPPDSLAGLQRRSQYLRSVLAVGYLIRDLAAGGPAQRLEIPMPDKGTLIVYPRSSEAAQFEYQAEVDLHLASAESFSASLSSPDQLPASPLAMKVILGDSLEPQDIPNAFLPPTKARPEMVRFAPEHVAALGLLGGRYGDACLWEGLGVHAQVPLHLHRTIQAHPDLLPAFRFWVGLKHFKRLHFRLEDFPLPPWADFLWSDRLTHAARLLEEAGEPVPQSVQDYVAHAWIPGHRCHFKKPEKWVL